LEGPSAGGFGRGARPACRGDGGRYPQADKKIAAGRGVTAVTPEPPRFLHIGHRKKEGPLQTSVEYQGRFLDISVLAADGSEAASGLTVDRYRLGSTQAHIDERARLGRKVQKDLRIRRQSDPDAAIEVRVQTADGIEERTFDSLSFAKTDQLWALLRYPYVGKGSPEAIQVTLQLAMTDLPGSPPIVAAADFQAYCDQWFGLDCNGFVGNYLRHVVAGTPWWDVTQAPGIGPDHLITEIFRTFPGDVRNSADQVDFRELNLLAMVDDAGKVIKGGGEPHGHIVLSGPGERADIFALKQALGVPDDQGVPAICVVESTGAIDPADSRNGLVRSFYAYVDRPGQQGVMRVHRGFNGKGMKVRVKGMHWSG
jgi:hypothetical protein